MIKWLDVLTYNCVTAIEGEGTILLGKDITYCTTYWLPPVGLL